MADETGQGQPAQGAAAGQAAGQQPAQGQPAVDITKAVADAVAAAQADFSRQLKELTGADSLSGLKEAQLKAKGEFEQLAETRATEASQWKSRYEGSTIRSELVSAASTAGAVDPETVHALLGSQAKVDDAGKVTIDGKPVGDAVQKLLKDKPYLAKASGAQGGGAPAGGSQPGGAETQDPQAIANKARAYVADQRAKGLTVSYTDAVRAVTGAKI